MAKRVIRVLDNTGDSVVEFDSEAKAEDKAKAAAKALFERLTKERGATAFDVSKGPNEPARVVKNFADVGEETILVPRIVGG